MSTVELKLVLPDSLAREAEGSGLYRARLADRLLESLEQLSDEENAKLWAEEAIRRDKELDADPTSPRPRDVLRDAFAKLK